MLSGARDISNTVLSGACRRDDGRSGPDAYLPRRCRKRLSSGSTLTAGRLSH
jgi:hypothetical protein